MMPRSAADLSSRLARDAEAVCRHYLSNGRRQGQYWLVGDVRNAPGGSVADQPEPFPEPLPEYAPEDEDPGGRHRAR